VGRLPANADPDAQARFGGEEWEPRLAQARAGQRTLFLVDAAPFVLAPFRGVLWAVTRLFLRAPAGRQRFTVLGALKAITPALVPVPNDPDLTAPEVGALLRHLAALNLGVPVPVVLDNARYPRCAHGVPLAASLPIEGCFLPPYSPHLTLIDRGGKFVKTQGLYSTYSADFAAFKPALMQG
jgi:hypothetical protein